MKKTNQQLLSRGLYIWGLVFLCVGSTVLAQTEKDQADVAIIEATIEMIAENSESENLDYSTLFDDLYDRVNNPINLNNCTKEDLSQLLLLNEIQINNIYEHIEKNGKLISIYELQSISTIDLQTIATILPFVKVNRDFETLNVTPSEVFKYGKHELLIRNTVLLEDQKGFLPIDSAELAENPNARYLGNKHKLYTRYRFKYRNNISFGVTAEKDAGEEFFKGTQSQGFDYYSAHFFVKNIGPIKRLAIGDYQLQFGQGLTAWTGLSLGKSPDVMNIKKSAQAIKPYTSVNENLFMRGVALSMGIRDFEFTAFYSSKKIDANVVTEEDEENAALVSSFVEDGFHRRPSEIAKKDAADQTIMGGNLAYKKRNFSVGFTALTSQTGASLDRRQYPYNQFYFTGDQNLNMGLDYNYIYKNVNLFGEISRSLNGGIAYLNGVLASLDPRLSIVILQRHYDRDFQNSFSNGVGEISSNNNEDGLYFGAISKLNRKWTLSGYYDTFTFKWLRSNADAPSHGTDWRSELKYKHSKKVEIYIRGRRKTKQETPVIHLERIDNLVSETKATMRINGKYKFGDDLKFQSRVELSEYVKGDGTPEKGYVLFQDVTYKLPILPITFSFRYALVEASYNAQIYAYENDVLYAFSIPPYGYRGTKMYLMARLKLRNGMSIWLRYAQTYYDDRDVSGSSMSLIETNTKSEVKAMLKYKF